MIKIKVENWIKDDGTESKQLSFLPRIDLFWYKNSWCLIFGWLMYDVQFWFGDVDDVKGKEIKLWKN